jgi:UDP-glucose 4-epimerase
MKLLVTGGAGYIGSATAQLLLEAGHEVVVLDNLSMGHCEAVPDGADFVEADLLDAPAVREVFKKHKPDGALHFAALSLVGESMRDPGKYFGSNVGGAVSLLEAMRAAGTRLIIFSSTAATYGEPDTMPITEETPTVPTNPYGESKLMIEKVLAWYERIHGIRWVALRYFNACGALDELGEDHDPETHLIPLLLLTALGKRQTFTVFGDDYPTPDGTCVRDYIHIRDLARAHTAALDERAHGAYNLGTTTGYSVKQVLEAAEKVVGRPIPHTIGARRPGDPPSLVADHERITRELGWRPECSTLEEIIGSAWAWHSGHPDGYGAS